VSDDVIEGLKLIRLNTAGVDEPDDPSYPYKLKINLRPPELMQVAFVMMHGGSEIVVVRGKTREAIDRFIEVNNFRQHPRLRRGMITGPEDLCEKFGRDWEAR
jgi:hypothetical protein